MGSRIYRSGVQRKNKFGVFRIYIEFIALRLNKITKKIRVEGAKKMQGLSPENCNVKITKSVGTEPR